MHVYLIGFMAVGKSTVGRELAGRLGWTFVDLDAEIEGRAGVSVAEIFEREGEEGFRRRERQALELLDGGADLVVATGGGAFLAAANRETMRRRGVTVWIDAPFADLVERLAAAPGDRPLFVDARRARGLFDRRRGVYEESELRVETAAGTPPAAVAERIVELLRERRCAI